MRDHTALRIVSLAFDALMEEALRCPCNQDGTPLCVRCECLFRMAVAAIDFASAKVWQPRTQSQALADRVWARQAPLDDPCPGQASSRWQERRTEEEKP